MHRMSENLKMPSQAALSNQLDRLEQLAINHGLYDAHDYLRACRVHNRPDENRVAVEVVERVRKMIDEVGTIEVIPEGELINISYAETMRLLNRLESEIKQEAVDAERR
jgi:hypothetical protein